MAKMNTLLKYTLNAVLQILVALPTFKGGCILSFSWENILFCCIKISLILFAFSEINISLSLGFSTDF